MLKPKYFFFAAIATVVLVPSLTLSSRLPTLGWVHANQQPSANFPEAPIAKDSQTKAKKRARISRKEAKALRGKYEKKYRLSNQEQGS